MKTNISLLIKKSKYKKGIIKIKYLCDTVTNTNDDNNRETGCSLCKYDDFYNCSLKETCIKIIKSLHRRLEQRIYVCPIKFLKDKKLKKTYENKKPDITINI